MSSNRPTGLVLDQTDGGIFVLFDGRVFLVDDPFISTITVEKGQMVHLIITKTGDIVDVEPSEAIENQLDPRLEGDKILVNARVTERNTYQYPVYASPFSSSDDLRKNMERLFWSPVIGYVTDDDNHFTLSRNKEFYNCTVALSFSLDLFDSERDLDERNCVSPGLLSNSIKEVVDKCEKEENVRMQKVTPWILERHKADYISNTLKGQRDETRIGIVIAIHMYTKNKWRAFLWNLKFGLMPIRVSCGMCLPQIGETYTFFTQAINGQICAVKLEPAAKAIKYRVRAFSQDKLDIRIILPVKFPKVRGRNLSWKDDFYGKFCIKSTDIGLRVLDDGLEYSDLAGKTVDLIFSYADPQRREDQKFNELFHWEMQGIAKEDENEGPRHGHYLPSLLDRVVPTFISQANTTRGPSHGRRDPSNQEIRTSSSIAPERYVQRQSGYSQYRGQELPPRQFPQSMILPPTKQIQHSYNRDYGRHVERNHQNQIMTAPPRNQPISQSHLLQRQPLFQLAALHLNRSNGPANTGYCHATPTKDNRSNTTTYGRGNCG